MPTLYPNEGELLMMLFGLTDLPLKAGLFRNTVPQDGGITYTSITELTTGGGRLYAQKSLVNSINMTSYVQDQYYVYTNSQGRAEAFYCGQAPPTTTLDWTFNATDVADGYTVKGVFQYAQILPFDAGTLVNDRQPMVGDTIKGVSSSATAVIAAIAVFSGTWAAGTAAGWMVVGTVTGTFVNDENLTISGEIGTLNATPTAGGTGYALGDLFKITTGGIEGLGVVTAAGAGIVSSVHLAHGGRGYTTGTGKVTEKITGAGNDDLTVNITALGTSAYCVSNTGTSFSGDLHKKLVVVDIFSTERTVSATAPIQFNAKHQCYS